jgi:hypothetical protein
MSEVQTKRATAQRMGQHVTAQRRALCSEKETAAAT